MSTVLETGSRLTEVEYLQCPAKATFFLVMLNDWSLDQGLASCNYEGHE